MMSLNVGPAALQTARHAIQAGLQARDVGVPRAFAEAATVLHPMPAAHPKRVLSTPAVTHDELLVPKYVAPQRAKLSRRVRVVPYGVLGMQMVEGGMLQRVAVEPTPVNDDTPDAVPDVPAYAKTFKGVSHSVSTPKKRAKPVMVIADPTRLSIIEAGPKSAVGPAAALYKWVGDNVLPKRGPFPQAVRDMLQEPTQACLHEYGEGAAERKVLIHAVGPDLASSSYSPSKACTEDGLAAAKRDLALTYANILSQFAEWLGARRSTGSEESVLRVVPVSGTFAGVFKGRMPELTAEALLSAADCLPQQHAQTLTEATSSIELCIFDTREYDAYRIAVGGLRSNLIMSTDEVSCVPDDVYAPFLSRCA